MANNPSEWAESKANMLIVGFLKFPAQFRMAVAFALDAAYEKGKKDGEQDIDARGVRGGHRQGSEMGCQGREEGTAQAKEAVESRP